MSGRRKLVFIVAAALLLGALVWGGWTIRDTRIEAQILRGDPDTLPARPNLLRYAVSHGGKLYAHNCAACHRADGSGDRAMGAPDLTDRDWLYDMGTISDIALTIRYGIRSRDPHARDLAEMPAYASPVPSVREKLPSLRPDEISDLVDYLMRLEKRSFNAAAATRGQIVFRKAGCWDCHANDAQGDSAIGAPNLTDTIWLFGNGGRADIFRSIADGHQGICPAWTGKMSEAQILEVAAYVWSRAQARRP